MRAGRKCNTEAVVNVRVDLHLSNPPLLQSLHHILRKGNKLRLIRGWGATRGDPPEAASPYSPPFLSPGGIGEAVASALVGEPGVTVTRLAVSQVPRSGKPAELLKMFGIDRDAIAQAVRGLVTRA